MEIGTQSNRCDDKKKRRIRFLKRFLWKFSKTKEFCFYKGWTVDGKFAVLVKDVRRMEERVFKEGRNKLVVKEVWGLLWRGRRKMWGLLWGEGDVGLLWGGRGGCGVAMGREVRMWGCYGEGLKDCGCYGEGGGGYGLLWGGRGEVLGWEEADVGVAMGREEADVGVAMGREGEDVGLLW